jgi:hypothetical protein
MTACLCEKPECREGSGFTTERYPVHRTECFRTFLVGCAAKFLDGTKENHAELLAPPVPCGKCSNQFRVLPGADCQFAATETGTVTYKHYVDVPRLGNPSKTRETLREDTVTRAEFIDIFKEHWSKYLLHVYVCDCCVGLDRGSYVMLVSSVAGVPLPNLQQSQRRYHRRERRQPSRFWYKTPTPGKLWYAPPSRPSLPKPSARYAKTIRQV